MQSSFKDESELSFQAAAAGSNLCDEFDVKAKLEESEEFDQSEDDEDGDDFTFASVVDGEPFPSSTAEDMFHDGKIRPVFPLFDQSLIELPHVPLVRKVFVEAGVPEGSVEGDPEGPYCAWSVEAAAAAVAASPEACKKSNSTGFSKIWRFKEMSSRSNSDGRDAYVFLNKPTKEKKAKDSAATVAVSAKKKGGGQGKGKTAASSSSSSSASAHEVYMKSRAASREDDRRKSYLPYKPELVGFFTNVHGGMSKNIHPF